MIKTTMPSEGRALDATATADVDERPELLQGAHEDLAVFDESDGLLVDARDLFRLVRSVENGQVPTEAARRLLTDASGRFTLPGE